MDWSFFIRGFHSLFNGTHNLRNEKLDLWSLTIHLWTRTGESTAWFPFKERKESIKSIFIHYAFRIESGTRVWEFYIIYYSAYGSFWRKRPTAARPSERFSPKSVFSDALDRLTSHLVHLCGSRDVRVQAMSPVGRREKHLRAEFPDLPRKRARWSLDKPINRFTAAYGSLLHHRTSHLRTYWVGFTFSSGTSVCRRVCFKIGRRSEVRSNSFPKADFRFCFIISDRQWVNLSHFLIRNRCLGCDWCKMKWNQSTRRIIWFLFSFLSVCPSESISGRKKPMEITTTWFGDSQCASLYCQAASIITYFVLLAIRFGRQKSIADSVSAQNYGILMERDIVACVWCCGSEDCGFTEKESD